MTLCSRGRPLIVPAVLDEFIIRNRDAIMAGTRARVALRPSPIPRGELTNGIPVFLEQLVEALRLEKATDHVDHEQIGRSAGRHGYDLLRNGLTIA